MEQFLTQQLKDGSEFGRGSAIPELVKLKAELVALHNVMVYPNNTLDELIDQLGGPDAVAEMVTPACEAAYVAHRTLSFTFHVNS